MKKSIHKDNDIDKSMKNVEKKYQFMYNLCDVYRGDDNIMTKIKLLKDIMFALGLGMKVIGSFVVCLYLGIQIDRYFHTQPVFILIFIILAFIYVMHLLIGEIWNE